jgi:hypothetical protein
MKILAFILCNLAFLAESRSQAQIRSAKNWSSHIVQQNSELGDISEGGLYRVKIEWVAPLLAGTLNNSAKLFFYDAYGVPKAIRMLSFKPFMVSMGHGSLRGSKLLMKPDQSDGSNWTVENIFFSMAGQADEWAIDIEGSFGEDKDRVRVLIPVPVTE